MKSKKENQQEFVVVAVFGKTLAKLAFELDKIPDEGCVDEYGGMVKKYVFHSQEAADAYRQGCADCDGWEGFHFLPETAETITAEKAQKFFDGEDEEEDDEE